MDGKRSNVTERDLEILKMCLEQKFMTLRQVAKMFFGESKDVYKVPLRRLNILMKRGLLRSVRPVVGGEAVYLTTREGVSLLQEKNLSGGFQAVPGIDYKTFEHDRLVTDVGIVFRSCDHYKWVCERKLRQIAGKAKVPDAVLYHDGYEFLIEVERTLKKNSYYEKIFERLSCDYSKAEAVLYLTDGVSMLRHLQKLADGWERIYFATLKDFFEIQHCTEFLNCKNDWLILEGYWLFHPNQENSQEYRDEAPEDFEEKVPERKHA